MSLAVFHFIMAVSPMHLQGEIVGPVVSVCDDDFTCDAVSVVDPAAAAFAPLVPSASVAQAAVSPWLQVPTIVPGVSPPPGSAGRAHQVGCSQQASQRCVTWVKILIGLPFKGKLEM